MYSLRQLLWPVGRDRQHKRIETDRENKNPSSGQDCNIFYHLQSELVTCSALYRVLHALLKYGSNS